MNFKTLTAYEVFTPSMPAKEAFVERPNVTNRLVEALRTPGKQVIIYGHSGSGKSTLIERKLFELYENHITTSCIKGMSFESVLLDAFDQLAPFYSAGVKASQTSGITAEVSAQWLKISSVLSEVVTENQSVRLLPPQLTVQNLARFVGAAKARWVLEDFHKLEPAEKKRLSQAMKMFMDMAKTFPEIKTVAVGAVGTAREVVQYDSEMKNRVAEIEVELMESSELAKIIEIGAKKLNVKFDEKVADTIVSFSNGLPSVCHQLCLNTCIAAGVEVRSEAEVFLTKSHFEKAVREYVETSSDTIRDRFDRGCRVRRTRKHDNYGLILSALCLFDMEGATVGELSKQLAKTTPGYKTNNVGRYLKDLQTDGKGLILRHDEASGKFSYSDPFIRSYALAFFEAQKKQAANQSPARVDTGKLLELILKIMEKNKTHLRIPAPSLNIGDKAAPDDILLE